MIKAVVFDFDGVIVDGIPLHDKAYVEIFRDIGIDTTVEYLRMKIGKTSKEVIQEVLDEFSNTTDLATIQEGHLNLLQTYYDKADLSPHLPEFLEMLREKKIRIALASSTNTAILKSVAKRNNIDTYFEAYIGGELVEKGKPSPEMILKALSALDCDPKDALAIDDAPSGIAAAKSIGMEAIGYTYFSKEVLPDADIVVDDFLKIPEGLLLT